MNLTLLLFELFSIVILFSLLMFYAGVKYNKYKIAGFNFQTPPSLFNHNFSKNQNRNNGLEIIKNNETKINKTENTREVKLNHIISKTTTVKLTITPRMTIYKTIDEE